jgi:hypothetical protein
MTLDGISLPMIGKSTPGGIVYTPTASKNGARANAKMPTVIAATIPIMDDLKSMFTVGVSDALRHYEGECKHVGAETL